MANALFIYKERIKPNAWARWMINRTRNQNKNNLISITGKTGSGKTLTAISICEIMEKLDGVKFDVNDHVVFSLKQLMDLINSKKLRKGSRIVCDEFQVSISAREFQSKTNKVFNYVLSTFRHLNLTLFFCTPFETLLDKNTRKLFHGRFETMSINKKNQTCRIKPRFVEYSDFKADPYTKQMIISFKDKEGIRKSRKLFHWDIPRPSKKAEEDYEIKKVEFTSTLNKNISLELDNNKSLVDKHEEKPVVRKPLTEKQERVMKVLANIKGDDKFLQSKKILGIALSTIHQHKELAEKKGYTLKEFRKSEEKAPQSNVYGSIEQNP